LGYIKSRPQHHADYTTALCAFNARDCELEFRSWRLGTLCGDRTTYDDNDDNDDE